VPLSALAGIMGDAEGWKAWFRNGVERGRPISRQRTNGFVIGWEEFAEHEIEEPCVVAFDEDGKPAIWDGFHRIAGAFVREAADIAAIVGRRKPDKSGIR